MRRVRAHRGLARGARRATKVVVAVVASAVVVEVDDNRPELTGRFLDPIRSSVKAGGDDEGSPPRRTMATAVMTVMTVMTVTQRSRETYARKGNARQSSQKEQRQRSGRCSSRDGRATSRQDVTVTTIVPDGRGRGPEYGYRHWPCTCIWSPPCRTSLVGGGGGGGGEEGGGARPNIPGWDPFLRITSSFVPRCSVLGARSSFFPQSGPPP